MAKNSITQNKDIFLQDLKVSPKKVGVRELCSILIRFQLKKKLPSKSSLIFRFRGGRNNKNDWYLLQAEDPFSEGYAQLELSTHVKVIPLVTTGKELFISYFIAASKGIPKETQISFLIQNTLAQSIVESNKKIEILVKFPSKDPIILNNRPSINVVSTEFDHINIICPSIVQLEKSFSALIRVEDKYYNLIPHNISEMKIYHINRETNSRQLLREFSSLSLNKGIKWISNLQFEREGTYHLSIEYCSNLFKSNVIICMSSKNEEYGQRNLYWGYLHGHTTESDGMRSLDSYFKNLINAGLDFGTSTEHDHAWETPDEGFDEVRSLVNHYNENTDFVSIFGYEYGTWYSGYGDICIYYKKSSHPIFRSDINKYNSTRKLIKNLQQYKGEVLLIGHHTALRPGYRNWDFFDQSLEKLVEIYSAWGNQEYSYSEGNPIPPRYKFFGFGKYAIKRGAILGKDGCYVRDALQRGYKLGFTAGGDDHIGAYPSGPMDIDNGIYPSGIMAVWSNKEPLDKDGLWKSLDTRRCFGTTGPRVILQFWIENYFMGKIIHLKKEEQLHKKRRIKINAISPINIEKVEIVRNNKVVFEKEIGKKEMNLNFIDTDEFDTIALEHSKKSESFIFYYPRLFLDKLNMAWASPIWLVC